jgi:hypothetical protein
VLESLASMSGSGTYLANHAGSYQILDPMIGRNPIACAGVMPAGKPVQA